MSVTQRTHPRYTEFGQLVRVFMAERDIRSLSELAALLSANGYPVGNSQRISHWLRGVHAADKEFPAAFARVLELSDEEKMRLAMAFTYGQTPES